MSSTRTNVKPAVPVTNRISRISWGAIIAGGLTALAVALLLNLLGAGIGFATIDPMEEANPLNGLGTGSAIWWIASNVIALFVGGMVAARTSGFPNSVDGGIHGFLAWGFYATVSFLLLSSTVSSIVSGVGGTIASVFSNDNQQQKVIVELDRAKANSERNANAGFAGIKEDIFNLINKAERYNILPDDASEEARATYQDLRGDVKQAWNDLNVDANVDRFFNNLSYDLDENGNLDITVEGDYFDKTDVREYLVDNTELDEAEINGLITKWENNMEKAVNKAEQYYAVARQKAIVVSDRAAEAMAAACIIAFFALLIGAIAGYAGGYVGSPEHLVPVVDPSSTKNSITQVRNTVIQ
ncbi:MAG: hypothetical protein AAFO94_15615 [Bacteroidota bacterium]